VLDEDDRRRVIADMWRMHLDERVGLDRIYEYTKGLRGAPRIPEGARDEIKDLARLSVMNILAGIRDTWTRNLSVIGYRRASAFENDPAWAGWQRNRMDARQKEVHKPAVTYGAAYLTILYDEERKFPVWRPRSPRQQLAAYRDPALDAWPQYSLETWLDATDAKLSRKGILLDDEWVYPFDLGDVAMSTDPNVSQPITAREFGEPYRHGARFGGEPVCPVVRFINDRDADDMIVGEIAPLIIDQQAINNVNFDRLAVSRFGASPQWVISGWTGSAEEVLRAGASRILTFEDDVKAQSLPAASIAGYSDLIDSMKAHAHEKAGLSPATNGKLINLSAEALALAGKSENEKLTDKKESLGESWEQAFRLSAEMDGDVETAFDAGAEVQWRETEARSLAAEVDAATKLAAAGVPIASLLPMVRGMTQQQIRGIQEAMQAQQAQALVAELRQRRLASAPASGATTDAVAS
jgi:hypothetical protein